MKKIFINVKKYVEVLDEKPPQDYYIVRTYSAGVFAGEIIKRDGKEVVMTNARRLWYWSGAASLSELAIKGVFRPENCKFPAPLLDLTLLEAVEIIKCTDIAKESIENVPVWSVHV